MEERGCIASEAEEDSEYDYGENPYCIQDSYPQVKECIDSGFCVPYAKFLPYCIGRILRTLHKISSLSYRKDFAYPTQNFSPII